MKKFLLLLLILTGCNTSNNQTAHLKSLSGTWRFSLQTQNQELPFLADLVCKDTCSFVFRNGEERIPASVSYKGDSIFIQMPFFNSGFSGTIESPFLINGVWHILRPGKTINVPFIAERNKSFLFTTHNGLDSISPRYHAHFSGADYQYDAIGLFNTTDSTVTGSFATETGDYRFLAGNILNNELHLSCFDGTHAYLFKADISGDSLLNGTYISALGGSETWKAGADSVYSLSNPDSIAKLKTGVSKLNFKLPNSKGDSVSYQDMNLQGKVAVFDIMGTWCPNCLDATRFYTAEFNKYKKQGLEIIPVAYERTEALKGAIQNLKEYEDKLHISFPFLIGGIINQKPTSSFPDLQNFSAYPTAIIVDKTGRVRKISTGFYGPGTGKLGLQYTQNIDQFIRKLLAEK